MSRIQIEETKCPRCGQKFSITLYNSVNVSMAPRLKDELLNGKLNRGDCPKCGTKYKVDTVVLYHDMEGKTMITVLPESFLNDEEGYKREYTESMNDILSQLNGNLKEKFNEYFVFVVFGIDELRKKLDMIDVMREPGVEPADIEEKISKCRQISNREIKNTRETRIKLVMPTKEAPTFRHKIKRWFQKFLP